jgi:uncharacterized protein
MDFITEIVEYSKTIYPKSNTFAYTITTNGLLLDRYMDFLVKHDFKILVSLDGGSKSNNFYRQFPNGELAFDKIFKNIKLLQKTYPTYFNDCVDFSCVLHNKNYSYSSLKKYFMDEFNKEANIVSLSVSSVNEEYKQAFLKLFKNSLSKVIEINNKLVELPKEVVSTGSAKKFVIDYSSIVYQNYIDFLDSVIEEPQGFLPTGTCNPFSKRIFFTVDGKIFPCEKIGDQYLLGTYDKEGLNLNFDEIASKYNYYFDNIIRNCKTCYMSSKCSRCMFKDEVVIGNPNCFRGVKKNQFVKNLLKYVNYIEKNPTVIFKNSTNDILI